jgi:hypothetical protein
MNPIDDLRRVFDLWESMSMKVDKIRIHKPKFEILLKETNTSSKEELRDEFLKRNPEYDFFEFEIFE